MLLSRKEEMVKKMLMVIISRKVTLFKAIPFLLAEVSICQEFTGIASAGLIVSVGGLKYRMQQREKAPGRIETSNNQADFSVTQLYCSF